MLFYFVTYICWNLEKISYKHKGSDDVLLIIALFLFLDFIARDT